MEKPDNSIDERFTNSSLERSGEGAIQAGLTVPQQGLILFCILFFCYAYVHQGFGANQNSRLDLLHAIFTHKTFAIDDYQDNTIDKSFYAGHYYSDKAPGIVALAIPSFAVSVAILRAFQIPLDSAAGWLISSWITTVGSVGLLTALGGVAMFAVFCNIVNRWVAFLTALVAFLGTVAFTYATMLFSHSAVMALLCVALWLIADRLFWARLAPATSKTVSPKGVSGAESVLIGNEIAKSSTARSHAALRCGAAGLCCGLAIASEYTAAIVAGGVLMLAFLTSFKRGVIVAFAALPSLMLIPLWNWMCFGSPFAFGYHHLAEHQFQQMNHGIFGIGLPKAEGAWVILLSPERGLFFWSPFLLMAFLGVKSLRSQSPKLLWIVLSVVILHVVCISGYFMPGGGRALGPRHLTCILPFIVIPAAYGLVQNYRIGLFLGYCSLIMTGTATLIDGMTPLSILNPAINYYLPRFLQAGFARNLGSQIGLPPYLSACIPLSVMFGAYFWAIIRERKANPATDRSPT